MVIERQKVGIATLCTLWESLSEFGLCPQHNASVSRAVGHLTLLLVPANDRGKLFQADQLIVLQPMRYSLKKMLLLADMLLIGPRDFNEALFPSADQLPGDVPCNLSLDEVLLLSADGRGAVGGPPGQGSLVRWRAGSGLGLKCLPVVSRSTQCSTVRS
jgi:hypothetical protein